MTASRNSRIPFFGSLWSITPAGTKPTCLRHPPGEDNPTSIFSRTFFRHIKSTVLCVVPNSEKHLPPNFSLFSISPSPPLRLICDYQEPPGILLASKNGPSGTLHWRCSRSEQDRLLNLSQNPSDFLTQKRALKSLPVKATTIQEPRTCTPMSNQGLSPTDDSFWHLILTTLSPQAMISAAKNSI